MSKPRGGRGKGGKKESAETCEVFTRPKGDTRVCFLDNGLVEVMEGTAGQLDVITLKNPSSLKASNYIVSSDGKHIRELLQFCQPHRAWFIDESIQADGNIYLTTQIDPLFLILPYLMDTCSEMASPMDTFLVDQEFPDVFRLQKIITDKQLNKVSDEKGSGVVRGYKFNEAKTLDWLTQKCQKVSKILKDKKVFVGQGAISATFISPDSAVNEIEDDKEYLTYAFAIVSDYISEELSILLKKKLGIEDKAPTSVKRKSSKSLQDTIKKVKTENDENVADSADTLMIQEKKPEVKLTPKDKALAKAASGTKNIMSFFKKK